MYTQHSRTGLYNGIKRVNGIHHIGILQVNFVVIVIDIRRWTDCSTVWWGRVVVGVVVVVIGMDGAVAVMMMIRFIHHGVCLCQITKNNNRKY